MHSYDPSRHPYGQIPAMRPARETPHDYPSAPPVTPLSTGSSTPIYEALCAEFRRAFRTLPGDRSGEEDLVFRSFGTGQYPGHHPGRGFGSGAPAPYPGTGWQPFPGPLAPVGHYPAALPPAPRRGL
ncbi:hypothetical protein I3J09_23450 [Streptomyces clavuligerus]|uniref:hypothetical protein n=2 Tax=Streptomyces clavuligerus TaxID=1901 RepID=UPI00020D94A5|nr:hypothetical protein [Streptomyces clavuligerus]AXU15521.1 hypothetical protein D1794_24055 [Streptomyces clavuligerus]MBY6305624.1 hypothetical protein [Streptomyces clavuligerus]QCS08299.1 hypothetical protein CRV15_23420 [Streptomyces clavuligerus]QPJ92368.1 hypothetical protein GE265_04695 [Streptomyces clavuligerus]QPL65517.1 hypothetical protein I3J04_23435 [Streptomyces clavuligerus]